MTEHPETPDLTAEMLTAIAFVDAFNSGDGTTARTLMPLDPVDQGLRLACLVHLMRMLADDIVELAPDRFADAHDVIANHLRRRVLNAELG